MREVDADASEGSYVIPLRLQGLFSRPRQFRIGPHFLPPISLAPVPLYFPCGGQS